MLYLHSSPARVDIFCKKRRKRKGMIHASKKKKNKLQIVIYGRFWGKCRDFRRENFLQAEMYNEGVKRVTCSLPRLSSYRSPWNWISEL
jgi:hypothetical protein